jgi:hypothetical protein
LREVGAAAIVGGMPRATTVLIAMMLGAWAAMGAGEAEAAPRKAKKAAANKKDPAGAKDAPKDVPDVSAGVAKAAKAAAERVAQAPMRTRPAVIYLNGDGAPVRGGKADDPSQNRASALGEGKRIAVPPFAGTPEAWGQIVACVKKGFAPFAVDVVTARPPGDRYSMIVVGGSPSLIKGEGNVGGYAPLGNGFDRQLVGFVFSDALRDDVAKVCQGVLHESGHLLGLDHVYSCEDPMSYLSCGEQRFSLAEEPCGESEPRACKYPRGTHPTQSSARLLGMYVGWRDGKPPVPEEPAPPAHHALPVVAALEGVMAADEEDLPRASGERPAALTSDEDNAAAAAARADSARAASTAKTAATRAAAFLEVRAQPQQRGNGFVEIVVEARSDRHVEDAALRWSSPYEEVSFGCGELALGHNPDASCRRQGNVFFFRIRVGAGQRGVRALALDARDIWLVSRPATLTFAQ